MRVRAIEILLYMGATSKGKDMNHQSGHLHVFRKTDSSVPQIIIPPPRKLCLCVCVGGGDIVFNHVNREAISVSVKS